MNHDWSTDLHAGLTALPRRCLFCNECVRVTLTGLSAGQTVAGTAPPRPLILLVTFGTLCFEAKGEVVRVHEGQMLALNPSVPFRLSATEAADFLVLCASCPMRRDVCNNPVEVQFH